MDLLLFALFNFIAFFFLIIFISNKDVMAGATTIFFLLLTGIILLTDGLTMNYVLPGSSNIQTSACTSSQYSENCTYSLNQTAASISTQDIVDQGYITTGLGLSYAIFSIYLLAVLYFNLGGGKSE